MTAGIPRATASREAMPWQGGEGSRREKGAWHSPRRSDCDFKAVWIAGAAIFVGINPPSQSNKIAFGDYGHLVCSNVVKAVHVGFVSNVKGGSGISGRDEDCARTVECQSALPLFTGVPHLLKSAKRLVGACRKGKRQKGDKEDANHNMHSITLSAGTVYSPFREVVNVYGLSSNTGTKECQIRE